MIKELVARARIDAKEIEDLILGCAFPEGEQGFNIARLVGNIAGLPLTVAGVTVNSPSVVAAHSLVTKDVTSGYIVGGTPAKQIGRVEGEGENVRLVYFRPGS